jgi:parallel beta-helix repeat protein
MTFFRQVGAVATLAAALFIPSTTAQAAVAPRCGAAITASTTLRTDLANCPGDGLVIAADNVTLDLGRRTLDGTGAAGSQGIRLAGHRGVTIKGGTIQEFATGVGLDAADGNHLRELAVRGSTGRGIDALNGSDGNAFDAITATGNRTGLALTASERNTLRASTLSDNAVTGVLLFGASRNRIEGNRVAGNGGNGVAAVEGSGDNQVLANAVDGSETGLIVDTSDRNLLSLNRVTGGGDGILVAGNGNTVAGNLVDRSVGGCETCSGYGIGVLSGDANALTANLVQRSLSDGINVAAPGTRLTFNFALRNGGIGINAVAGVRDGGRNHASGNAARVQCVNVRC